MKVGSTQVSGKLGAALAALVLFASMSTHALDVGTAAPDFTLQTIDGQTFRLAEQRGKVVVVDLWASWCVPCRSAFPELNRLATRYASNGLVILGVSSDESDANVRTFAREQHAAFPLARDPFALDRRSTEGVFHRYGGRGMQMPSSYLVDRNGILRYVRSGYRARDDQAFEQQVRQALGL